MAVIAAIIPAAGVVVSGAIGCEYTSIGEEVISISTRCAIYRVIGECATGTIEIDCADLAQSGGVIGVESLGAKRPAHLQ
jgi:hypothetical protein